MWNVFNYLISKENFLCRFFHAFCQFVIIIMLALGDVWLKPCFPTFIHIIALDFVFHHNLCLAGGNAFVKQHIYHFIHTWFQGEFEGYACSSFIPLLPDGNQLIIHSYRFLDMEQAKFKFASRAVGRNVHCCIAENTF